MTENMEKDLIFYVEHNDELYFDGLSYIAIAIVVMMIAVTGWMLYNITMPVGTMIGFVGVLVVLGLWFSIIKMYLHMRKAEIEIMEWLRQERKMRERNWMGKIFGGD
jgi:hypothetical protein